MKNAAETKALGIVGRMYLITALLVGLQVGTAIFANHRLDDVVRLTNVTKDFRVSQLERVAEMELNISELAATIGLIVFAWYLAKNVRLRVAHSWAIAQRVRDGDLTHPVVDRKRDEFSLLVGALPGMQQQLTATDLQNATNAASANSHAAKARGVAERGGNTVGEVVVTMQAISGSSRKISEIIAVMDGIAFQTNVPALDAAVEAARA